MLGRPLDGLAGAVSGGPTFESYGESDYDPVAPFASGALWADRRAPPGRRIAVAVNGRVVAVTRSFEHDGDTPVSAVTPEDAYRTGANSVRVFVVQGLGDDTVRRSSRRPP